MAKILFVTNDAWFFVSHRLPIAQACVDRGDTTVVSAKSDASVEKIKSSGSQFTEWKLSPRGKSPLGELRSIWALAKIIRRHKPDIVHFITIKPVLYGGILARLLGVPAVVFAVSGMGSILISNSTKGKLLRSLIAPFYKFAVSHAKSAIIFQNPDDRDRLLAWLGHPNLNVRMIKGSGVNLDNFSETPEPEGTPVVMLAARLIKEKGVKEFVEAAAIIKQKGIKAKFIVAGGNVATGNPGAFSDAELKELEANDAVEFLGHRDDIPELFATAAIVTLPSYYPEGLPKVLLEASAACRPIVTTDTPGCRDAVINNETGVIIPPRDSTALADAIEHLLSDKPRRIAMGRAGRELIRKEMSIEIVVAQHLAIYDDLIASAGLRVA